MTTEVPPPSGDRDETAPSGAEDIAPPALPSWEELGLSSEVRQALVDLGYLQPMPVQAAVYKQIRDGKDMMVQARTGTGKTAAFGIPIVEALGDSEEGVKALILTPTRELALQVAAELGRISSFRSATVVPIYGGAPINKQIDQLAAGAQIVAGTPGRVLDHIRRKTLKTDGIRMLALDECDEMLSMGFQEEIENIIERLPGKEERQTLLFSATIPDSIQRIARKHLTDPEQVTLSEGGISVDEIDHGYYIVSGMARMRDLLKVITVENPDSAIIFCNTRDETSSVAKFLTRHGLDAEAISSDLSQKDRERVMTRMRNKDLPFLVATDIAARGIDISDLPYVINYTFPESAEVYVHRTGRTGRAGKRGIALSLVGPREIGAFYYLKLIYKIQPEERDLPGNEIIAAAMEGQKLRKLVARITDDAGDEYRTLARRLMESDDGERVIACLLKRLATGSLTAKSPRPRNEPADAGEDEAPRRERSRGRERGSRERGEGRERAGRERGEGRERGRRRRRDESEPVSAESSVEARDEGGEEDSGKRRRRRRRRDRDEAPSEARDTAAAPEASADDAPAADVAAEPTENPEAEASPVTDEKPKRRRSSRRAKADESPAESSEEEKPAKVEEKKVAKDDKPAKKKTRSKARSSKKKAADDDKEFWEAWADEKQARDPASDDSDAEAADSEPVTEPVAEPEPTSVKLYVNIGKREEVSVDDVRALLSDGLDPDTASAIGSIALRNTHCYVRVPAEFADAVIAGAEGKSCGERDVVVERARRS